MNVFTALVAMHLSVCLTDLSHGLLVVELSCAVIKFSIFLYEYHTRPENVNKQKPQHRKSTRNVNFMTTFLQDIVICQEPNDDGFQKNVYLFIHY